LLKEEAYPTTPGVYWMSNAQGEILYIGKAKNLRSRIRSYFQKPKSQPRKVIEMMQQMANIDWMPLGSEIEALITEAKLIKLHQPHFNRMVKHYQHFPFIKITAHEDYPQISVTPHLDDERAIYFGPFNHKSWVETTLENVGRLFRLRSCSSTVFKQHKFAPCLEYSLNQCSGPCAGLITPEVYKADLEDLMAYLKGQGAQVIGRLEEKRNAFSDAMAYEKAQDVQVQIQNLLLLKKRSDLLSRAVHDTHCLILLPSVVPGALTLILLLHGQIQRIDAVAYHQEALSEWVFSLASVLDIDPERQPRKTFIPKEHFEETRLVMSWLQSRPERPTALLPSLPNVAYPDGPVFPETFAEEGLVFPISLPLSMAELWASLQETLVQPVQTKMSLHPAG
jgi:excinuclease ABC subunit C